MSERAYKAGSESSEFKQVKLAQRVALAALGLGAAISCAGALLVFWSISAWPVVVAGSVLSYVGGELLEKTVAAYAQSRGAVKASANAPPTTVVSPSVRLGPQRL